MEALQLMDDGEAESAVAEPDAGKSTELSHVEAMQIVNQVLGDLIETDPMLYDLPQQVTLEEVNSCIALEYGQAMTVYVRREDNSVMSIIVTQNATVLDLKNAIKRYITLKQKRNSGKTHLSWKYIWKRYWLYFQGQKLTDDKKLLKEYEIRNKAEVTFIKRLSNQITTDNY